MRAGPEPQSGTSRAAGGPPQVAELRAAFEVLDALVAVRIEERRDGPAGRPLGIEGDDRHEMGQQRPGGVEFLAAHDHVVAVIGEPGLEIGRPLGPALGEGVASASACARRSRNGA